MARQISVEKGAKFEKLTFTGEYENVNRRWYGKYDCDCGNKGVLRRPDWVNSGKCKSCGCNSQAKGWKDRVENYGKMYPFLIMLKRCKKSAKPRKLEVSITEEDIKNLWEKQKGICFYTGIKLELSNGYRHFDDNDLSPSIDRIDSDLAYTKENIKIVHREINRMKLCLSHEKFVEYCKIISKRFKHERF